MTEYIYRVVDANTGEPVKGGTYRNKRQHTYTKQHVAQGVATSMNNEEDWLFKKFSPPQRAKRQYKVQRAPVVWEDIDA